MIDPFPIKVIISLNQVRHLQIRLVKLHSQKSCKWLFFSKYIGSIIPSMRLHVNTPSKKFL